MWRDSWICVPWLVSMCAMTHLYLWHDSCVCSKCDVTHEYVCHDSFLCVPWLISMCAMTHFYVCHDSFLCVLWRKKWRNSKCNRLYICAMTYEYAANVTCDIHMCAMTRFYVCHDASICVTWLMHMQQMWHDSGVCHSNCQRQKWCAWRDSFVCVPWRICICAVTHLHLWHDSC